VRYDGGEPNDRSTDRPTDNVSRSARTNEKEGSKQPAIKNEPVPTSTESGIVLLPVARVLVPPLLERRRGVGAKAVVTDASNVVAMATIKSSRRPIMVDSWFCLLPHQTVKYRSENGEPVVAANIEVSKLLAHVSQVHMM
jgi:hypothetical protein